MEDFLTLWAGNFEDHVAKHIRGELPDVSNVAADPLNAHADSDTEVSESPCSENSPAAIPFAQKETASGNIGQSQPQTPPLPPWKKAKTASSHAVPSKARPSTRARSSKSCFSNVVDEALKAYRAAELAISKCADESLYGSYNQYYYKVEEKVAREQQISWRDRGPRADENNSAAQPEFWKSQRWRPDAERYANRGGKHREYFKQKYGVRKGRSADKAADQR